MKVFLLAAILAAFSFGASAGELAKQRAAVASKLKHSAPAVPTGIEVAGTTNFVVRPDGTTRSVNCQSVQSFFDRETWFACGRGGESNSGENTE